LRLAFEEQDVVRLQAMRDTYQHLLPGLQWLERRVVREIEPLLPETVLGALLSPRERSLQGIRLTLALARGATLRGADLFEGHFRDGLLLGPLTGSMLAELLQGHACPFDLDLAAFDPDRFGDWNRPNSIHPSAE
jgi:glycine/D-amino acid oxidase-like deaminating enzyme